MKACARSTICSGRERWILHPLVAMTLLLGVYPGVVLDIIRALGRRLVM